MAPSIQAILDGERDPVTLAQMRDYRIKSSCETIAKSLKGNWRKEHLFTLKQEVELYQIYRQKIIECDLQIEKYLDTFENKVNPEKNHYKDQNGARESHHEMSQLLT